MNIAVKGQQDQLEELMQILPESANVSELKGNSLGLYDLIFDLDFDDDPEWLEHYAALEGIPVVVGAVKVQLEELCAVLGGRPDCVFIGMNTLPTFIDRSLAELTVLNKEDKAMAESVMNTLGWTPKFVQSRVGMVTPRIVCMIINEAYFTLQEGTANREDIDLGMKLGTAYPKGPFEWCDQIGVTNVYEVLNAMYEDTRDERYKICPALKSEYLKAMAL